MVFHRRIRLLFPVIWSAILIHLAWATALFMGASQASILPSIHALTETIGSDRGAAVLLVSVAAISSLTTLVRNTKKAFRYLLLLPQNLVLGMSAGAGVHAAVVGHYYTGDPIPRGFVLALDAPVITAFLAHTFAIIAIYTLSKRELEV